MAQYTVSYACSHGSREMQLYGPNKERARKIEWMERTIKCPACTKADRIAADNAAPRKAHVHISGVPMAIQVELTGQIEPNKDALRARGWGWSDEGVGALSMLATRPEWHFVRVWSYEDEASLRGALAEILAVLDEIGWEPEMPTEFDVGMALTAIQHQAAAKAEKEAARAAAIAANPRPARPEWYATHVGPDGTIRCNRKVYGTKDRAIYVNGTKVPVTAAQVAEIEAYWAALDAYARAKR